MRQDDGAVRGGGFFDFLSRTKRYQERKTGLKRLDLRREFLVLPYLHDIEGARVLDLAAQDGRWTYALAEAGAREVVGVEARPELVEQYANYPDGPAKERTRLVVADVFDELPRMAAAGETFDVVAVYGLYYHVMDHYRLLRDVVSLKPRLVIIDSEFSRASRPVIDIFKEDTDKYFNSIAHVEGQALAPVGVPSKAAVELMAFSLGYTTQWADWDTVPEADRAPVGDYYPHAKKPRRKRGTCALRPIG